MPANSSPIPPEAKESDITLKKNKFLGPGGVELGKKVKLGLANIGTTSIDDFIKANPARFSNLPASLANVMRGVSQNEGLLEAVNTWDNAFLSFSIFQWTAGTGAGGGELVDFLDRLKTSRGTVYDKYFGVHGLGLQIDPPSNGAIRRGFLVLDGQVLNTPARKAKIRTPIWAYRFWRAGHDDDVRTSAIEHGMGRIKAFYGVKTPALKGKALADFITSEVGVAHLLDQHINRPGHVPGMMAAAINAFVKSSGKKDPASWTDADEKGVIASYLVARRTDPRPAKMTDSKKRAERIQKFVDDGILSDRRGSFVA